MLADAYRPGEFGGTGTLGDWELARELVQAVALLPVVLAGGLDAGNVEAAIAAVRPAAVDTASGVEVEPGRKDHDAMARFVAAARRGFDQAG